MMSGEMRQKKENAHQGCRLCADVAVGNRGLIPLEETILNTPQTFPTDRQGHWGFIHQFPSHIVWKLPGN